MPHTDDLDLRRLTDTVAELRAISAPPGGEGAAAARVRRELEGLGLTVREEPAPEPGGEPGILRVALDGGSGGDPVLLCARLGDGGETGAALLLAVAHRARTAGLAGPVELLFTVADAGGAPDGRVLVPADLAEPAAAYAFEHPGPVGELVGAAPTGYRISAEFIGRAPAHNGLTAVPAPDEAHRAVVAAARAVASMPHGRIDDETTADVASIAGADERDDRCLVVATARSLSEAHAEAVIAEMVDHCYDAANEPECACDVDISVERLYSAYRHRAGDPAAQRAEAALRACGVEPRRVLATVGSVAGVLQARGIPCVNLADGADRPDLLLRVVLALVAEPAVAA